MTTSVKSEPKKRSILDKFLSFFGSYKGLIAFIIIFELAIILFLSTFSEPVVKIFGDPVIPIDLEESDRSRAARIIMLYHALAVPFIAAVAFFVMDLYEIRESVEPHAKWSITTGAIITGISGIDFAYGLTDWTAHGIYLLGLSISFYGGVLLAIGIFPTKEFPVLDTDHKGSSLLGRSLEYINVWLVIVAILISSVIGAIAGSRFGNGFEAVLAEDIVREEHDIIERMVISHLHIMIALLAAAAMMIVFRYSNMRGKLFHYCMILVVPGTIITSIGAWLVITGWESAHMVINVGAMFSLAAAFILAVYGIKETSKVILGDQYSNSSKKEKLLATTKDPVNLGMYFQFIWVNIVVTFPGVYVAINLDTYRTEEYTEVERAFNTGHWHVLATQIAIILLLLSLNYFDVKGTLRKVMGWSLTLGSIIAFGFATFYMLRSPNSSDTLKDTLFILIDVGVAFIFVGVALFCVNYLVTLFSEPDNEAID
ncbi:MAG: hypothetical protein ACXAD7_17240 [Candidatus Kariarchaeaceae archaeon]|jgi:hypothetical protein